MLIQLICFFYFAYFFSVRSDSIYFAWHWALRQRYSV